MQEKAFTLHNKGMNRDLSISKAGESAAYENHNIRIEARDGDTALSVTNERGNKEISLGSFGIVGELLGWNVLDNHIILFTHENNPQTQNKPDHIYRIDYNPNQSIEFSGKLLFDGNLDFDLDHPIESVVYHETDNIKKIYWVDGKHVLRFMNFVAPDDEILRWNTDPSLFDSNKGTEFNLSVSVTKDYSGNTRPNGVIQYIITYYNDHGQETGPVWVSDLIYLSPSGIGGPADGTNTCRVTLDINGYDTKFTNYRVYSIFRSSENGTPISYIVSEGIIGESNIRAIDDYANQIAEDASRLLYLGSQPVIAGTLTHKDQTLFLGDISSAGRGNLYDSLDYATGAMHDSDGYTNYVTFELEYGPDYPTGGDLYPYENQLKYSSSEILSFKGGEKYRFALVFKFADGTSTDAFWIGDAVNDKYPLMDDSTGKIKRIVANITIPQGVFDVISHYPIQGVQAMIAEATYADRSVKAQGILCPTVFNVWERYNKRLYSAASWIMRPRNSQFSNRHLDVIANSTDSYGEIDCNYWKDDTPTPYYRIKNYNTTKEYADTFDGVSDYDLVIVIYGMHRKDFNRYSPSVSAIKVKFNSNATSTQKTNFLSVDISDTYSTELNKVGNTHQEVTLSDSTYNCDLTFYDSGAKSPSGFGDKGKEYAWSFVYDYLSNIVGLSVEDIVEDSAYYDFCDHSSYDFYQNGAFIGADVYSTEWSAAFDNVPTGYTMADRWLEGGELILSGSWDYTPSYYRKHLMFVDENVVTLNSPELEYNAISFDNAIGLKFRVVGVAKITSSQSDYVVDATPGKLPGENLISEGFSATAGSGNLDGLISWPLWKEYGLDRIEQDFPADEKKRESKNFKWAGRTNNYWLHMWNHTGKINGFTDEENNDYSTLKSKVFATLRVSAKTVYNSMADFCNYELTGSAIRVFNYISSQYVGVDVLGEKKYYDGNVKTSLMPPGDHMYPVLFSTGREDTAYSAITNSYDLLLNTPVSIEYRSTPHAVIALPCEYGTDTSGYRVLYQETLPFLSGESVPNIDREASVTGALLPWIDNEYDQQVAYPYIDFKIKPKYYSTTAVTNDDKFVFIGEIYQDFPDPATDTRYGGTSKAAIQNNRFIPAGPLYDISSISQSRTILANRGDTYFQRWDCLKTKPYNESTNGVIDITSVMLETHINIDGRTDLQRGVSQLASIDYENFNSLNPVYSQKDVYQQRRDLDEDFNLDSYRSTLTWTLQKSDLADVDEWTHITLASTLKLDGDLGILRALRRMQNNIIAFQDKGISEILFNSRTQLTTTDGVPIEIANSGKVDGKRYITNKYGCINKWSIVEGKAGLYFVDNINKAFCLFSGNAVDSLSDKLGFGVWFKDANKTEPWSPADIVNPNKESNLISFYDREHSDIYLVKDSNDEMASLVYNENLQAFTSFFDYSSVPMISNVRDRLISFKNDKLWLQNEGLYCNFFKTQYDFWVQYRVTPEPFSDKIWTNFDYRADFYHLLDGNANPQLPEEYLINGDFYGEAADIYKENETFTFYKVWDEYQTTGDINLSTNNCKIDPVRKKFRIWRIAIARAMKDSMNIHGLDRIRNPWINIMLIKNMDEYNNQYLAQLHDVVVRYFE